MKTGLNKAVFTPDLGLKTGQKHDFEKFAQLIAKS
jgi:hypothetical protein